MNFTEKVLFVDDEPNILSAIKRQLHNQFNIETAPSGDVAITKLIDEGPFAVIVVDMRMPGMDGLTLLKKVKEFAPDTIKMMLTGNVDVQTAQNAINEGNIFRYMVKPSSTEHLIQNLNAGLRQYQLLKAEKELLEETLQSTVKVLVDILSLVNSVAFSKTQRLLTYVKHIVKTLKLEQSWQYEVATMLSQIGSIVIPQDIFIRQASGLLTKEDTDILHTHPAVTRKLIEKIPRMNQIAVMIENQNSSLNDLKNSPKPFSMNELIGAQLLKIALDLDQKLISGMLMSESLQFLISNPAVYNPKLVSALDSFKFEKNYSRIEYVTVDKLDLFMIAAQNIEDKNGRILLAKDQEITPASVEYLKSFAKRIGIKEPFQVKIIEYRG
ncbi:MAG TPA: response regulator [Candidatus Cloacimonadota bacterium]|nr:response regulator [Candidatus Cloacimonadota bacterium]